MSQFADVSASHTPFKSGFPSAVRGALYGGNNAPAGACPAVGVAVNQRAALATATDITNPLNRICIASLRRGFAAASAPDGTHADLWNRVHVPPHSGMRTPWLSRKSGGLTASAATLARPDFMSPECARRTDESWTRPELIGAVGRAPATRIPYNQSCATDLPTGANLASTGVLNRGMHAEHH